MLPTVGCLIASSNRILDNMECSNVFESTQRNFVFNLIFSIFLLCGIQFEDGKVPIIKKAMAFTGNRSKSSIGISFFKVKRLFSG
jgi:hypothetical protein